MRYLFKIKPILLAGLILLSGFAMSNQSLTEEELNDVCQLFVKNPQWYQAVKEAEQQWGVPVSIIMAIIYQESKFKADARPVTKDAPWHESSSAYGYAQAVNSTWKAYKKATGNTDAKRNNFADSADFIGWFASQAHKLDGVTKSNAYRLYLAYYDGVGGFLKGLYVHQHWLVDIAHTVAQKSEDYKEQLSSCHSVIQNKVVPKTNLSSSLKTLPNSVSDESESNPVTQLPGKTWYRTIADVIEQK